MRRTPEETKVEQEAPRDCGKKKEPLIFSLENVYEGVPVSMKGTLKSAIKTASHSQNSADAYFNNDCSGGSSVLDRKLDGTVPSLESSQDIKSANFVESLEISAYEKKSTALIRHILTSALNLELRNLDTPQKISLSFSVFSSKRYLMGVVAGLNDLLKHLSISTEYYLDEKTEKTPHGSESSQVTVSNSNGETIYSIWKNTFQP
ncbi:hypothetical protein NEMIN01_1345 [Nematocida minor]|uniref:uncharacterized protein n=1 Tax=Nematocida minor TaxID=1912983 RepID=UPI00221F75AE|nr:uncharacterized protein NEMIN01_1345 [Nematocida minor]KAI5191076.1 hypothetical protein NEMIN01_1345 [Nematocida minor]